MSSKKRAVLGAGLNDLIGFKECEDRATEASKEDELDIGFLAPSEGALLESGQDASEGNPADQTHPSPQPKNRLPQEADRPSYTGDNEGQSPAEGVETETCAALSLAEGRNASENHVPAEPQNVVVEDLELLHAFIEESQDHLENNPSTKMLTISQVSHPSERRRCNQTLLRHDPQLLQSFDPLALTCLSMGCLFPRP